ncbi:MAG: hypothetical protein CEN88_270, partial [Candidatus Berkelbacteria bacterium Licking1014_2]
MKVKFIYSQEREIERLYNLLLNYQWFVDNNFPIETPSFLKRLGKKGKKETCRQIKLELDKVDNKENKIQKVKIITAKWKQAERSFFNSLEKYNLKNQKEYSCYLCNFGPQGQFQMPNIIYIRIKKKKDIREINETIAHELIHLMVYDRIKNMDFEQKEGIIDMFFVRT